jgi:formylglycine-generating enzyme required for sulfatase activity
MINPVQLTLIQPAMKKRIFSSFLILFVFTTCNKDKEIEEVKDPEKVNNSIEMVLVQGGTFQMGSATGYGNEEPVHAVTVSSYYIAKTEVTQKQWRDVMGSSPSYFKGDDLPVEQVSWNDVQSFITKLNQQTGKNYRLPTEAEWEFAARGGNSSKGYTYSGSNTIGDVAWYYDNNGNQTPPVGTKAANEQGLYDMSGNVWEWCSDFYDMYDSSGTASNPQGPASGSDRVLRGGGWTNSADYCRVAIRGGGTPDIRDYSLGFRLAHSSN